MSRLTIVEGNSNDKDNVRAIMVKGEKGEKGDNGEITYSDVVDNLTTTSTQLPLSANQGKQLKDLVENAKEEMDNKIKNEIRYIFPGKWNAIGGGDSMLMLAYGKSILLDTNSPEEYTYVKKMLNDNNVTHIDYMIITHFDGDHCGNFINLVNDGYIDSETVYLHGLVIPEIYGTYALGLYNNIEDVCRNNNITSTVPEQNSSISIEDLKLHFFNTDYDYIYEQDYSNNNCSLIVKTEHHGQFNMFIGDADYPVMEDMLNNNFVTEAITLYHIGHHSQNQNTSNRFLEKIRPVYAVGQVQMEKYSISNLCRTSESSVLEDLGTKIFNSFENVNNIEFVERNGSTNVKSGVIGGSSSKVLNRRSYYVDINTTNDIQDGTEDYPFVDLPQAIGKIKELKSVIPVINLKNGTYCVKNTDTEIPKKNLPPIYNFNYIEIVGESVDGVIIKGLDFRNSSGTVTNCTIIPSIANNRCLDCHNSKVNFITCKIKNSEENQENTGLFCGDQSNIRLTNCEFSYLDLAINSLNSTVTITGLNVDNCNKLFETTNTSKTFINSITNLSNITTYRTNTNDYLHVNPITQSLSSAVMTGDINLNYPKALFKTLRIKAALKFNNINYGHIYHDISVANTNNINISTTRDVTTNNTTAMYLFSIIMSLLDNKITINRNANITLLANGTMTLHNPASSTTSDYGLEITSITYM